ncbi:hypothetical protein MD484_g3069, partial [Candolleomyces efflorescens]
MPNKFTRRLKSLFSRSGSRSSSRSNSTTSTPTSSPPTSQRNSAASCDAYAADLASLLSASPTATLTENDWEMAMQTAHAEFGLANSSSNTNSNSADFPDPESRRRRRPVSMFASISPQAQERAHLASVRRNSSVFAGQFIMIPRIPGYCF